MVMTYNPNSKMILVLEDNDEIFKGIENFLNYSNLKFKHYISWQSILSDFILGNLEYKKIILDNQVPRYDDRCNMLINGGLEVAEDLLERGSILPSIICLHTSCDKQETIEKCNNLGIMYIKKKDWISLERFLQNT